MFDRWNLIPGRPWQEGLEEAIKCSRACAVFLGPDGLGSWEHEEMRLALDRRVRDREFHVVPVLLPNASMPRPGELPPFLSRLRWIDFRLGLNNDYAFHELICGIEAREPGPPEEATGFVKDVCPFPGLEPFHAEHAPFFCGREALTQQLVEALRLSRFLAVLGPSGRPNLRWSLLA